MESSLKLGHFLYIQDLPISAKHYSTAQAIRGLNSWLYIHKNLCKSHTSNTSPNNFMCSLPYTSIKNIITIHLITQHRALPVFHRALHEYMPSLAIQRYIKIK